MLSAVIFLNARGDVVLSRTFRPLNFDTAVEAFRSRVIASKGVCPPVVTVAGLTFMYIRPSQLYVVAVADGNASAIAALSYLHRLLAALKEYYGGKEVTEKTIAANLLLSRQVLDETMDWGWPQVTSPEVLSLFVESKDLKKGKVMPTAQQEAVTIQATGGVPHRRQGIRYAENEAFIDVNEKVNLLVSAQGTVLRSDVSGQVMMKCFLSGMPECRFGFNDRLALTAEQHDRPTGRSGTRAPSEAETVALEDVTFHQCVKLTRFDTERDVTFTPPDGTFELMRYRITEHIAVPFEVTPLLTFHGRTRIELKLNVRSRFPALRVAKKVLVRVPVPAATATVQADATLGKARYEPESSSLAWRIRNFAGETSQSLHAEIQLLHSEAGAAPRDGPRSGGAGSPADWWVSRPPISLEFKILFFTSSGLAVKFLRIHEKTANYTAQRYLKSETTAGDYTIRF
jgi:AP-2 complex subunit mu-1